MATNKFATMVNNNTNRLTLILIYVALEWALIIMLLLNALFSYLILSFSQFFGLQTPCIFCSRLDHVFDSTKKKNFHCDLLCEAHVSEVSKLCSCSNVKNLVELTKFCENYSKVNIEGESREISVDTQKGTSIIELDGIEKSEIVEDIKLFGLVSMDCSIDEINDGDIEKGLFEEEEMNMGTFIGDKSCSEDIMNNVEQYDDQDRENITVFKPLEIMENECDSLLFQTKICDLDIQQRSSDSHTGEAYQMPLNESEDDVSIGTEIPDIESTNGFYSPKTLLKEDDHGIMQVVEDIVELKTISTDSMTLGLDLNEVAEEKILETPSSNKRLHHLHKSLPLLEVNELGKEESYDGSVTSEFQGVGSIEHLISALNAERKALNDLYSELEEERNANAIAADETMAMINRLQEEKAAMEMEALHYQRMMEEKSQYDQEALEVLNELVVKREKEKQDLEKELEMYRKSVLECEGKGNIKMVEKESESASFSSSNCGDSDGLSFDYREDSGEDSFDEEKRGQNTPAEAILRLDGSSDDEERLLILHQLKLLEKKCFAQAANDAENHFDAFEPIDHIYEENEIYTGKLNGTVDDFTKETNGKHEIRKKIAGMRPKRLLPLFQATENGDANSTLLDLMQSSISKNNEFVNRNPDIEEEFDRLYDRLQALEADKEFNYLRQ